MKKELEKFHHEWSDSMRHMLGKTCSVKTKLKFKDHDIIAALSSHDGEGESQNERLYFPKTVLTKTVISNDESIKKFLIQNKETRKFLSATGRSRTTTSTAR